MTSSYLDPPLCANDLDTGGVQCASQPLRVTCPQCHLVVYCSGSCCRLHFRHRRADCSHPFLNSSWKPEWYEQRRVPNFDAPHTEYLSRPSGRTSLWGDMPAVDLLNIDGNEGDSVMGRDLSIMSAASGDLRNIVKTVCGIPELYAGKLNIVMNDVSFDVVARNAILLLTALYLDTNDAVPAMIHLWYSARLPSPLLKMVQDKLLHVIEDACEGMASKPDNIPLGRTFTATSGLSIRLVFTRSLWNRFKGYLVINQVLAAKMAPSVRIGAIYNPARRDLHHKRFFTYWPAFRMCIDKFRKDGILLPYGSSREEFDAWNPTFLQKLGQWPVGDDCDPHRGWSHMDITKGNVGARDDYLGAQFFMLRDLLFSFCHRVKTFKVAFRMYCVNAHDLPAHLISCQRSVGLFDRIEMSNICDRTFLGPAAVIATYAPLLKPRSTNPHATLLLLFRDAVPEMYKTLHSTANALELHGLHRVMESYFNLPRFSNHYERRWHPKVLKYQTAIRMLRKFEIPFDQFIEHEGLKRMLRNAGYKMRQPREHTITKAWPKRLSAGATSREFRMKLAKYPTGYERYVECVRLE